MRTPLPHNKSGSTSVSFSNVKLLNKLRKASLLAMLFSIFCTGVLAQSFFRATSPGQPAQARGAVDKVKNKGIYQLDEQAIRTYLLRAPMEFQNNGVFLPLEVPLPNGRTEIFNMVESPVLSPAVAAANPNIKTYTGNGQKDKKAVIRLSLTSSGFNAILLNVNGDAVYFESYTKAKSNIYYNYFVKDVIVPTGNTRRVSCDIGPNQINVLKQQAIFKKMATTKGRVSSALSTGGNLTKFRLAMPADAEFVAQNGGTVTSGFNAVVAYVNRIKAFYRNELSVDFELVSGTNMIYTNAATDPYDNDDQIMMLDQNQANCDAVLGNAGYDIGHVWGAIPGTSGGGIASSPSVCDNDFKGQGVSGEGDLSFYSQSFMDQLVFHEMGHQFGMSHSYNSSIPVCTTRQPATSVEPGAGATVMSYGFTCGGDDYPAPDEGGKKAGPILQFHTVSYQQAVAYLSTISCGVVTSTGNTPPTITMPPAYTIPKSTPFALTGGASDIDGDMLTFCWEGTNIGTMVPNATTLANTAQPPFFRSYAPSPSPTRIYPIIDKILDGTNYAIGDKLPSVTIATTHNFTVRDNHFSGGGVTFGSVTVNVDGNIGPFLETTNLSGTYPGNSNQTVTWSVNGTNAATPNIKISLSTDGGFTFPTVLLASTPNDGTQQITLPNITTTTARIKVEAVGNIFFDISNVNFSINTVAVTYAITSTAGANGTITPLGTTNVTSGASQTFTIAANSCYAIADVLVDGVSVGAVPSYTFTNVTATHTISASFSQRSFNIVSSAGANGSINPNGTTSVNCGANQSYTITPNALYNVQDVLVDGVSIGAATNYTFTNVTATHTISATFSLIAGTFTITSTAGAGGTITPSGAVGVTLGSNQTFNIAANSCYAIADVLVDGVSQGAISTYTFTAVVTNHTISASFSQLSYPITVSAGANGTITPGSGAVTCGTNKTYSIAANSCYKISDVVVDGVSQGPVNSYTFTNVTAAHTISATFSQVSYTITANAGANGSITPNGAVPVNCGANKTFAIAPNAGFAVQAVLVDGVSQGAITTYTFTNVTVAHTISATFVVTAGCSSPALSAALTSVKCKGSSTGAINLSTTGGSSPFTYAWTGPNSFSATSQDISGLKAGTYTVTVKATGGCTTMASYIITEPSQALIVSATISGTIACNGGKTSVVISASGGKAPYTGTGTITNQAAGSHTYTVTDSKGCSVSKTITISQPSPLVVYAAYKAILCKGGKTTVLVYVSGGTAPFTGTGEKTNQSAGSHTYVVTDARGCTSSKTINIAPGNGAAPDAPYAINGPSTATAGQTNVKFSVTAVTDVSYTWVVPSGATITSGQGSSVIKVKFGSSSGYVKVTASTVCGSSSQKTKYVSVGTPTITKNEATTVPTLPTESSFTVFPNPVQNNATVVFSSKKKNDKFEIRVSDASGKSLFTIPGLTVAGENKVQVAMGKYASAIYLVTLIRDDKIQTQKLIRAK